MPGTQNNFRHPGEELARRHFLDKGYTELGHNYHARSAEIDLILMDPEGTIHFIEVKSWKESRDFHPLESFHPLKIHKVKKAAEKYLSTHPEAQGKSCSFDLFWLKENGETEHFPNLF